ncbi:MAG: hypothetical protein UEP57_09810 [Oscillospiraceae bacterium]|nr:hypothetical protein [Oscillospiraceae bacterium]
MEEKTIVQAEQSELLELVKKLEAENAAQERYAKKQYRMACVSAAASVLALVVVIVCVAVLMPRVLQTFDQADAILADLEAVTSQLAESLPQMIEDLNALVSGSRDGISEAIGKIAAIDIDSLNEAIQDLKTVIEPLARLLGR